MKTDLQSMQDKMGEKVSKAPLADGFHRLSWKHHAIAGLAQEWERLGCAAGSPNPFFERWFLLPSLEAFDESGIVDLGLLVGDGKLRGLIPLFSSKSYHGRPLPHLTAWLHANMFCGAPLVAPGYEERFWSACLQALDERPGKAWFLHLRHLPEAEPVTSALASVCVRSGRDLRMVLETQRALLQSDASPQDYLASSMTTKARKELRRQHKRLEETGRVEWHRSRNADEIEKWIGAFLKLEGKGWKGDAQSALADDPRTRNLFRSALIGASRRGRLERLALRVDGEPVAMLATFLTQPGSFAFKTAFDEGYARFSPGMQLQLENLSLLEDQAIEWCDSCAEPGHPMIERIWSERRSIAYYSIPIGKGWRRWAGNVWTRIEEIRQKRRR